MVSLPPWLGDERARWLDEVTAWVLGVTSAADLGPVLELESVRERTWGAVLRVVTATATLFFKAPGTVGRHELRIISDLTPRWPNLVPDVLAVEVGRSWMLMADHGVPMRDVLGAVEQVAVIERLLPTYADMQRRTTEHVAAWLDVGAPDRRVDRLPELFDLLVNGGTPVGALRIDDAERTAHLAELPLLTRVCADLGTTEVADALDHADLHGTNVLVDGTHHRLVDWGDSCITHPFSSPFVPFEFVVAELPPHEQLSATLRLRDAYLEPWGPSAHNREAFGLAVWVAHITRAVNIAHETLGESDDQEEIIGLLRAWHAKRSMLRSDDVLQPIGAAQIAAVAVRWRGR